MSTADAELSAPPELTGDPPRILIIRAPYYRDIVDGMTAAATEILAAAKAEITAVDVAGAFELPQALRIALRAQQKFDGFLALGCVVMNGLMNVVLQYGVCLGTALLTVDTIEQARARSLETGPNKGAEAAVACLKQIFLARQLGAV
jgi:6,7-dimethyl-8-ribityllumazine synthase